MIPLYIPWEGEGGYDEKTVKFTNKIHPPLFSPFFLFKSMINNIPKSNK
jgi:hypothetical protein